MDEDRLQEKVSALKQMISELQQAGRYDLLSEVISQALIEQLHIEAARTALSSLVITRDFRFILEKTGKEVELNPIQKALYMLFLNHEDGIEFKQLCDHREELLELYSKITNRSSETIQHTIDRLIDPLDNAINEKCSRIKAAFAAHMDEYSLRYYIICGHKQRHFDSSKHIWFERKKSIVLPRELVKIEK